jgi:hypothetical protein
MDKEIDQWLQQMMECLLARQTEEMKSDIKAQVAAHQDQLKLDIKCHMEASLHEFKEDI